MSDKQLLDAVVMESKAAKPEYAIIWMHGLGADGNDFAPIVPELGIQAPLRFIFPHAPMMPVTINNGYVMRAWYDIRDADLANREDVGGLKQSAAQVTDWIDHQVAEGIPPENIILAGFSQGGAVALHAGLAYPKPLAGIMALSTYLMCAEELADEAIVRANQQTSIFMGHGIQDPVVPMSRGQWSCDTLKQHGYSVEWHEYMMPHAVVPDEIADIAAWLKRQLNLS